MTKATHILLLALTCISTVVFGISVVHAQGCSGPHLVSQWVQGNSWTVNTLPTPASCVAPVGLVDGTFANHVYSMDQNGHLIESFQSVIGGSWQVIDVTQRVNGTLIASEPIPLHLQNTPADIQIFALAPNGHLLSFVTTNNTFTYSVFDLTSSSGSTATLINNPAPIQFGSTVHVFVTDNRLQLHDFYKPFSTNWQDLNFTSLTKGHLGVAPAPYAYGGNSIQVAAVSGNGQGDLVSFVQLVNSDGTRSGLPSWFDLTAAAGGTQVASLPRPLLVSSTLADVAIFADDVNGHIVEYFKAPSPAQWREFTQPFGPDPGVTGFTPSAIYSQTGSADGQVEIFSNVSPSFHLNEYFMDPVTGSGSPTADLTSITGLSIFSDPFAVVNQGTFLVYTLNP